MILKVLYRDFAGCESCFAMFYNFVGFSSELVVRFCSGFLEF